MRLLLIEDRKIAADQFRRTFDEAGIDLDCVTSMQGALAFNAGASGADVLVISLPLENASVLDLVSDIRSRGVEIGVLVLQEMRNSEEAADLLDAGADDVVTKPIQQRPLVARLRALVRRQAGYAAPEVAIGGLRYFFDGRSPTIEGEPISLTPRERSLLECLVKRAGRIVPRQKIYESLYGNGEGDVDPKIIDVYICKLRKKLGPNYIDTAFSTGYRLNIPTTAVEADTVPQVVSATA